jgi:hypothetical protein
VIAVAFSPTGSGPFNGNITLTDNALGKTASTQTIAVSGVGTAVIPTAITVTAGNNQTTTPYSAFATNLTATVVDQNGFGASGVSVVFTAPATGAGGTFANGTNTTTVTTAAGGVATATVLTANGTRGTFAVTAKATGITTPATFSETIAGNPLPTVTVAYAPVTNPVTYGSSITLTATLTGPPSSPNAITGTVTFFDGTTQVGAAVTVSGGKAISAAFVPAAGAHSYTAVYAGDANYSTATSANAATLTVNKLAITATANPISIPYGTLAANVPAITGAALQGVLAQDAGNVTPVFTDPYAGAQGAGFYLFGVTLTGSAAANYTVTTTSGVTVTPAPTNLALSYSPTSVGPTTTVTLTATLTSAVTSGVLAGTNVLFYDGATLLGTRATGTIGVATLATTLALGTHTITATYAGATNFATTSTSVTVVVVNPDITLSLGLTSVTVKQGQVAVVPMTFNTVGGLTSTVTFGCSGLPANSACTTTPATFTASSTSSGGSGSVMVTTAGPGITASLRSRPPMVSYAGVFGLAILGMASLGSGWRRRKRLGTVFLVLLACVAWMPLSGCGGGSAQAPLSTVATPTGTSTITVTATAGTVSRTATFQLIVTPSSQQ